jgi:hypothetical protein
VVKELGDEAVAAGLDHTDDCTLSPDLLKVVMARCGFSPDEAALLVRENTPTPNDALFHAIIQVLNNHELERAAKLREELLAALLDEDAVSKPGKLRKLVKAALER